MSDLGRGLQQVGSLLVVESETTDPQRLEAVRRLLARALDEIPPGLALAIRNLIR